MCTDESTIAEQFGRAELGDERRSRLAQTLGQKMLKAPGEGLLKIMGSWSGCKSAYRLFSRPEVTRLELMRPHFEDTRAAAARAPVTLFVQDTTELDFTSMTQARDYGPIGNNRGMGLLVHSLLALTPQGEVLGLATQHCWARGTGPSYKGNETRQARQQRAGKESEVWPVLLEALGPVPAGLRWVSVGDRGSDSWDYWTRAKALGWECLSRIYIDRRTADKGKLMTHARTLASQGQYAVHQRARPGQAARTLHLNIAWESVQVRVPANDLARKNAPALEANVVRCWDDAHGVEWLLVFTGPVNGFEEAVQCVRWYEQRWTIEEFHKCLKSGCGIERSQLKSAHAVDVLLGFCSIVAVRLLALARMAGLCPDEPAAAHVDERYLRVLCRMRKLNAEQLGLREYWREIARIGGFLGRSHDAGPGWGTLWRGLRELDTWVLAWEDGRSYGSSCG